MNEDKERKERERWQKLIDAMRAEKQKEAERLAAKVDRAQRDKEKGK